MNDILFVMVRWVLASPILFARFLVRAFRWADFWATSYKPSILCRNCGDEISLLGMRRCHCGYTYKGHLLRPCPICNSLPRMARCFRCGVTEKLPEQ